MSATSVKLLQAAAEIVGGTQSLAERLGIGEALLSRFMADRRELPDVLLLRAVDIVLACRQSPLPAEDSAPAPKVAEEVEALQNCGRESAAASQTETA